jgi:hypothetical protein
VTAVVALVFACAALGLLAVICTMFGGSGGDVHGGGE